MYNVQYEIDKKRHRLNWAYKHTTKYGQNFEQFKKMYIKHKSLTLSWV